MRLCGRIEGADKLVAAIKPAHDELVEKRGIAVAKDKCDPAKCFTKNSGRGESGDEATTSSRTN
jgi:hypothetical protein